MTASIPKSWKNANIILIHNKGDTNDLKNYRPISLDFSYTKGYSTVDHIHTVTQVIEKCAEYNQPLHIAFIVYKEAFDSVHTSAGMQALRNQGVDDHYVRLLEDI